MLYNPERIWMIASERQRELLDEARRVRLIRAAKPTRPGIADRLLAGAGGFLIVAGKKLQARYTPVPCCASAAQRPDWGRSAG